MTYIPGQIHESFQKPYYYELSQNFSFLVSNVRCRDLKTSRDYDDYTRPVDLMKGDIIVLKYFNYLTSNYGVYSSTYAYFDSIIRDKLGRLAVELESIVSKDLVFLNKSIFSDITLAYERDKIIESILTP